MSAAERELIVLMGPAGAGKSTLGAALAEQTAWPFLEGDDYHPTANKQKQARGLPLDDRDRAQWLDKMIAAIKARAAPRILLACSALTPYVQGRLLSEVPRHVRFFLLLPTRGELHERLENRSDHFMPASLLDDQLSALTLPAEVTRLTSSCVDLLCQEVLRQLQG